MKKTNSFIVLIVFVVLLLPLSSCMHAVMMGSHDDHGDHQPSVVTKEVTNGENTLSVSISPMTVEKEGTIAITLRSKSSIADSVSVHYMISKSSSAENSFEHRHGKQSESNEVFKTIHQSIILRNGAATIAHTPTAAGKFAIVTEIENSKFPLSVETDFVVHEKASHGMMGMGSMWDYPIVGVLAMGGMMLAMWAIRGWL